MYQDAMNLDQGLKDYTHPWKQSTPIFIIVLFGYRIYMYMNFMWFIDVLINLLLLLITYISKSVFLFQDALTKFETPLHGVIVNNLWHYIIMYLLQKLRLFEVMVKILSSIVIGCVLNQSHGYWLLAYALQFIILIYWEILAFYIVLNNLVNGSALRYLIFGELKSILKVHFNVVGNLFKL